MGKSGHSDTQLCFIALVQKYDGPFKASEFWLISLLNGTPDFGKASDSGFSKQLISDYLSILAWDLKPCHFHETEVTRQPHYSNNQTKSYVKTNEFVRFML